MTRGSLYGLNTSQALDDHEQLMGMTKGHQCDKLLLVDLIKRMLQLDTHQHIQAPEVLQHLFLANSLPQSSPVDTCMEMIDTEQDLETSIAGSRGQLSLWLRNQRRRNQRRWTSSLRPTLSTTAGLGASEEGLKTFWTS
ncbi:hypothetical protein ABVT39_006501 [Epinephelus coioides]